MISDESTTIQLVYDDVSSIDYEKSIPQGEIWYLENIVAFSDGSGSSTSADINYGSWEDGATVAAEDVDLGYAGGNFSIYASRVTSVTESIGAYVTGEYKTYVASGPQSSQSDAITAVLNARRVL